MKSRTTRRKVWNFRMPNILGCLPAKSLVLTLDDSGFAVLIVRSIQSEA